jgi:carboxylesterase type B
MPDEPKNLIEQKQINEVPLIMGLNENEGAFTIASKEKKIILLSSG